MTEKWFEEMGFLRETVSQFLFPLLMQFSSERVLKLVSSKPPFSLVMSVVILYKFHAQRETYWN